MEKETNNRIKMVFVSLFELAINILSSIPLNYQASECKQLYYRT